MAEITRKYMSSILNIERDTNDEGIQTCMDQVLQHIPNFADATNLSCDLTEEMLQKAAADTKNSAE